MNRANELYNSVDRLEKCCLQNALLLTRRLCVMHFSVTIVLKFLTFFDTMTIGLQVCKWTRVKSAFLFDHAQKPVKLAGGAAINSTGFVSLPPRYLVANDLLYCLLSPLKAATHGVDCCYELKHRLFFCARGAATPCLSQSAVGYRRATAITL